MWAPPPHTRGSTWHQDDCHGDQAASPAHAGIDHMPNGRDDAPRRLPRTRGDRPPSKIAREKEPPPPPHTRGSTWRITGPRGGATASPAHAGIDPHRPLRSPGAACLPRTRGDRPAQVVCRCRHELPPPHTRGSTWQDKEGQDRYTASPAHAGIDPSVNLDGQARARLPRTRGDRPF